MYKDLEFAYYNYATVLPSQSSRIGKHEKLGPLARNRRMQAPTFDRAPVPISKDFELFTSTSGRNVASSLAVSLDPIANINL